MSTYSEVVSRILGLNGMRDYLARVISGKNPDGTNFSINSGATGSVLPSASGKSSGEVLTLTQDGRSDTADWREPTALSGSAALTTFTPAGSIAATDVQAAIVEVAAEAQPLDSDLTAIAALTTTTFGRALLALADAAAGRTALGLGTAAVLAVGADEATNTVGATGSTETIPAPTTATVNYLTLDANCTLTFPTAAAGRSFSLVLKQDATGSRTVTWPGTVQWPAGTAPTLTTTAAKRDAFTFLCVDGTNWLGFVAGQNF